MSLYDDADCHRFSARQKDAGDYRRLDRNVYRSIFNRLFVQFIETIMHNSGPRTSLSAVFVGYGILYGGGLGLYYDDIGKEKRSGCAVCEINNVFSIIE
jgi:hypothetical protein